MKFGTQTILVLAAGIFGTAVSARIGSSRAEDLPNKLTQTFGRR